MSQQIVIDTSHELIEAPELPELNAAPELLELNPSKNYLQLDHLDQCLLELDSMYNN